MQLCYICMWRSVSAAAAPARTKIPSSDPITVHPSGAMQASTSWTTLDRGEPSWPVLEPSRPCCSCSGGKIHRVILPVTLVMLVVLTVLAVPMPSHHRHPKMINFVSVVTIICFTTHILLMDICLSRCMMILNFMFI